MSIIMSKVTWTDNDNHMVVVMKTPGFDIDTISYGLWRDTLMDMQPDRSMKSGFGKL